MGAPAVAMNRDLGPDRALNLAAFAADEVTRSVIEQIAGTHWPGSVVSEGGIAAAASHLEAGHAPNLLLVDLGESDTPFEDLLGLADSCDPSTNVVALGKINDLSLYKQFIAAGVADYLVKPVNAEELETALLAASLREQPVVQAAPRHQADVVILTGSRGGVGVSTLAANLAWLAAEERGKKIALIDLDVQFGTAALCLDLVPAGGMIEALQNPSRIDGLFMASALMPKSQKLFVLAAEEEISRDIAFQPESLDRLLEEMRPNFDTIFIDLPRQLLRAQGPMLDRATHLLIVSDLTLAGLRDTVRLRLFCRDSVSDTNVHVLVNRVAKNRGDGMSVGQFERGIETSVRYHLPEDTKTAGASASSGRTLAEVAKRSKLVGGLRQIVGDLCVAEEAPKKGLLTGIFRSKG
ncbi:MAG: AAA family ATPase [Alphaproteobacteria bacterium]